MAFSMQTAAIDAQVRQEIRGVVAREALLVGGAEVERAGESVLPRERNERDAAQGPAAGKQQLVISPDVGSEPRAMQGHECGRQRGQAIDEHHAGEILQPLAAADEQVSDLVLRIQQHQRHGIQ